MDRQTAEQIMKAPEKIEVQYQDVPVWIESVNETSAEVSVIGTKHRMKVPLSELEYTGRPIEAENIYGMQVEPE
ncbi:MAG: small, acid-soluble spore protein, H family [Firmicutes bacterium]|jgi:H-type small acid-soluble spore protein|nr:small, acid-soluble spore protein, H family [Bacillota bacterium]